MADDPGAGKTIRPGSTSRSYWCDRTRPGYLIVAAGGLAVQWQDELSEKFALELDILGPEAI